MLISFIAIAFAVTLCLPAGLFAEEKPQPADDTTITAPNPTPDTAVTGGASIFLPESTFDFGDVDQSTTLTHVFKVQNKGSDTLKITKVRAS